MKMMGFVIMLGVLYWAVASYAQSMIVLAEPCADAKEAPQMAQAAGEEGSLKSSPRIAQRVSARWSADQDYQLVLFADTQSEAGERACAG